MEKENRLLFVPFVGKTSAYRQKEGYQTNKGITLLPRLTAVLPPQGRERRRGFTLIELLVVVLIIGILAAVALPQYQLAVLRSRYNSVKHIAKSLAEAQEVYYLTHGRYADTISALDVQFSGKAGESAVADVVSGEGVWAVSLNNTNVSGSVPGRNLGYQIFYKYANDALKGTTRCVVTGDSITKLPMQTKVCQKETGKQNATVNHGVIGARWNY